MMDEINKKIIKFIQGDIPLTSAPFKDMADRIGITEAEIIERINDMQKAGIIRRFGAVLRHHKVGFMINAMTAFKVDEGKAGEAGRIMAEFKEISHCYLREVPEDFEYNLFAMVHAASEEELNEIIGKIVQRTGLTEYKVFRSIKEMKKVSMTYF